MGHGSHLSLKILDSLGVFQGSWRRGSLLSSERRSPVCFLLHCWHRC